MSYAEVNDVKAIISQARLLTYITGDQTSLDAKIVENLNSASAEMDVYISRNYDLPLNTDSLTSEQVDNLEALLRKWVVSIALFTLIPHGSSGVPEGIKIEYDRTMSRLRDLLKGVYQLPYVIGRRIPSFQIVGDIESTITSRLFSASRSY